MSEAPNHALPTVLLRLFERAKEGRLSAGDLTRKLALGTKKSPAPGLDEAGADRELAALVEGGLLATSGGAKDAHHPRLKASYRLTDKGRHHLRPAKPGLADSQLEVQEAFILLQFFRHEAQEMTRGDLNAKLRSYSVRGQLEIDVKEAPETVSYQLAHLVEKGCLIGETRGTSVRYRMNPDQGPTVLASLRQHDKVSFTMTGEILNALLAAARGAAPAPARSDDSLEIGESPDVEPEPQVEPEVRTAHPRDIETYVKQLRSGPYAGKDLVPIHEVRSLVAEHHGRAAASHQALDPILMRMWNDGQIEMLSISDNRLATPKQLDDAIPGMNETIFYIVVG